MKNMYKLLPSYFCKKKRQEPALDYEVSDVKMAISPEDFPGDEMIAREIIPKLYKIYRDDAVMASMTFARGSVLMQDAKNITRDMVMETILNGAN
jgi:hypothetical protein